MENKNTIHDLMESYFDAYETNEFASPRKLVKDLGLDQVFAGGFFTNRAVLRSPNPIPVDDLGNRFGYFNKKHLQKTFDFLIENDFLSADYSATDKAIQYSKTRHAALNGDMADSESLPDEDMQRLIDLVWKMVEYAIGLDEPYHREIDLFVSRKNDSNENMHKQVFDSIVLFDYFRDDSHVAAWTPSGLAGHEWEALTYLWIGKINSAEALFERRGKIRGFSKADYAAAYKTLVKKGWAEKKDEDKYQITAAGQKIRDEAEAQTNANFEQLADGLSAAEFEEFIALITAVTAKLQKDDA